MNEDNDSREKEQTMTARTIRILFAGALLLVASVTAAQAQTTREFAASDGGTLVLDLQAGGSVEITGGGAGITVSYSISGRSADNCRVKFKESGDRLTISTDYVERQRSNSSSIRFDIQVPSRFNVELDSMGGSLSIDGVDGEFKGKTMGGPLTLHDVRGEASLTTMGGEISLTDSELDGKLKTMGGEVLFENVIGDVKGSSMGGNVRYKNVQRRDGDLGSPDRLSDSAETTTDTVQISTMGGAIEIEDAPEGASLHTMGGDIRVTDALRFVRAKTMGGDILIESVDGWVKATTMAGDVDVTVTGSGGDVELTSMSGDITLYVPSGFSMELELEIAYTRNSRQDYRIETPFGLPELRTREWDYDHGSPRKFIRQNGSTGGANRVKIETVNGNIIIVER